MKLNVQMINKSLIGLLFLVFLFGCASGGRELNPDDVDKLKEGMTISQVESLIGKPEHINTGEGGKTYYLYYHGSVIGFMGAAKGQTNMLNLTFNASDKLVHIDNSTVHQSSVPFGSTKTSKIERFEPSSVDASKPVSESRPIEVNSPKSSNVSNDDLKEQIRAIIRKFSNGEISRDEYKKQIEALRNSKKN